MFSSSTSKTFCLDDRVGGVFSPKNFCTKCHSNLCWTNRVEDRYSYSENVVMMIPDYLIVNIVSNRTDLVPTLSASLQPSEPLFTEALGGSLLKSLNAF